MPSVTRSRRWLLEAIRPNKLVIAYWDSAYIQYVVIIFMFIAGTNFGLLYVMLHGKFRKLFHDEEFKLYLYITLGASTIIAIVLFLNGYANLELSIRESIFQSSYHSNNNRIRHCGLPTMATSHGCHHLCPFIYRGMCRFNLGRIEMYSPQSIIQKFVHRDETNHSS